MDPLPPLKTPPLFHVPIPVPLPIGIPLGSPPLYVINYNLRVDFNQLAAIQPTLRPLLLILNYKTVINLKKQDNLIILSKAIMKHLFKLHWDCPKQCLCPRIPSRVNYLLWIHRFIGESLKVDINKVLDIGTGATLIYPLLGYSLFNWRFIATQCELSSYQHSQNLISSNQLAPHIQLLKSSPNQYLLSIISPSQNIDVVMCNPPFFPQDYQSAPVSQMKANEHHSEGGEDQFFMELYRESFSYPRIKVWTCLIGLKKDFMDILEFVDYERELGVLRMHRFGKIIQGNCQRFIVMWAVNFQKESVSDEVQRK